MRKNQEDRDISFLGKVILFVRNIFEKIKELSLPQRLVDHEKAIAGYDDNSSPKEAKIAFVFGMARIACLSLLCAIVVLVIVFGSSMLSYDNVYYMFKDIAYINSFVENKPSSLNYSRPFSNQDFGSFKNGLAVAGDSEIKLFTSTGRVTMAVGSEFTNPKVCSSDSSLLIYDQGRNTYKIFNSFTALRTETLPYAISSAAMADDGSFCVATKSEGYTSTVRVYNKKFSVESEYSRDGHIISVDISPDGKSIAVLSLDASNGDSVATITVLERGKEKTRASLSLNGILPYSAKFVSNDRIALICSDYTAVYDLDCREKNKTEYSKQVANVSVSNGGYAVLFKDNSMDSSFTLTVFGENGNRVSDHKLEGYVSDIALHENYAYALMDGEVIRIDTLFGGVSKAPHSTENASLVVFDDGSVTVCTNTAAYYISFN